MKTASKISIGLPAMDSYVLPADFLLSLRKSEQYPRHLVRKQVYDASQLKAVYDRLCCTTAVLQNDNDADTLVSMRDITTEGSVQKWNLRSDQDIKELLGDILPNGELSSRGEPRIRFVLVILLPTVNQTATSKP